MFGVGTLFAPALIKCCGVAINVAGLPNVRETLLRNFQENEYFDIEKKYCIILTSSSVCIKLD